MRRDYYTVLGVRATATAVEIRRAYQRLARQYSPDINVWDARAGAVFAEVTEAYRVLSDPSARALYDRGGAGVGPEAAGDGPRRRRGDDVTAPVELAFAQAVTGLETRVPVQRLSPCEACRATGARLGGALEPCSHCDGLGTVWAGGLVPRPLPCPLCEGAGARVPDPCPRCRGRGVALERAVVRVPVPPGVDTGSELRIAGAGHSGPFGGPRGDLVVVTRVHEHPRFERKGDNLHCEVAVSIAEAALGARVGVRGVDGAWIALDVPAGTQSGQVFRLRGRGMPRLAGGRGDLCVTARVETPCGLDERAQGLLRELARVLPPPSREPAPGAAAAP
jgi:molecular chaperone DnaJ